MTNKILSKITILALSMAMINIAPLSAYAVDNPVPVITSITPNSTAEGSADMTLTVNGTDFVNTSVVYFNGISRPTFYESSVKLTATIPAAALLADGAFNVNVLNPIPGGGFSNSAVFTVSSAVNAVPTILVIAPSTTTVGNPGFTLTVDGTNYVPGSVVRLDGSPRATTYVSSTRLTASILTSDIDAVASHNITVVNPTPGGGTSNSATLTVNPSTPVPMISSISPGLVTTGGGAFTLTVNGSNFVASNTASVVRVNGVDRATTVVSSNQLTATIPASDIATSGIKNITVFNPGPNSPGISNTAVLQVASAGFPALTSMSPSTKVAGSSAFTLTVTGVNFNAGSTIHYNGLARPTTYVSSTMLTTTIPASDVAIAQGNAVTVHNPGVGTSNALLFNVTAVPGLPNTGIGPSDEEGVANATMALGGLALASIGAFAVAIARKRKLV